MHTSLPDTGEGPLHLGLYVDAALRRAIDTLAVEQSRSRSQMVRLILQAWLAENRPDLATTEHTSPYGSEKEL